MRNCGVEHKGHQQRPRGFGFATGDDLADLGLVLQHSRDGAVQGAEPTQPPAASSRNRRSLRTVDPSAPVIPGAVICFTELQEV